MGERPTARSPPAGVVVEAAAFRVSGCRGPGVGRLPWPAAVEGRLGWQRSAGAPPAGQGWILVGGAGGGGKKEVGVEDGCRVSVGGGGGRRRRCRDGAEDGGRRRKWERREEEDEVKMDWPKRDFLRWVGSQSHM